MPYYSKAFRFFYLNAFSFKGVMRLTQGFEKTVACLNAWSCYLEEKGQGIMSIRREGKQIAIKITREGKEIISTWISKVKSHSKSEYIYSSEFQSKHFSIKFSGSDESFCSVWVEFSKTRTSKDGKTWIKSISIDSNKKLN